MDDTVRLANTCSTCKYSAFKTSYYTGKKQLGICMLHTTTGQEPPLPQNSTLYSYAVKHGEMMDIQEYVSNEWANVYGRSLSQKERLQYEAVVANAYSKDYFYSPTSVLCYGSMSQVFGEPYVKLTLEEYKLLCLKQAEGLDPFKDVERYLVTFVEQWHKFNENFLWWQENRDKMRRCHRNTTCECHEDVTKREPVARSVAKGNYKLEWK